MLGSIPFEVYQAWREDPALFAADALGVDPWEHPTADSQADILRAVPDNKNITVRSGHKVGKSMNAAVIALWGYALLGARVIFSAPTGRQVDEVTWRETRRLYREARIPLGGICHKTYSKGIICEETGAQIIGMTPDDPDAFSGFSGGQVIYIFDEAAGIKEPIFEAMQGNRAGGAWLIQFGNPTSLGGTFYDSHNDKERLYKSFAISSRTVARDINPHGEIPGLATPEWIDERLEDWSDKPAVVSVRIDGNFAEQGSDSLIFLADIKQAIARHSSRQAGRERLVLGVDVARFGDDSTVIQPVRGKYALRPVIAKKLDTMAVADEVIRVALDTAYHDERLHHRPLVKVDEIGVGAGVLDALKRRGEVEAIGVNVGEAAKDPDKYTNKRAEVWFQLSKWVREGGCIPDEPDLKGELAAVRYTFDHRQRYKVMSKDDMKDLLGRSPDRADALALAVYDPPVFKPRLMKVKGI